MPRPPARRRQFVLAPVRGQPERVTTAYNEKNIADLAQRLKDKPVGRVLSNSDDSDELVTKAATTHNRRGVARREVFASGGLGKGDEPASLRNRKRTSDTLKELNSSLESSAGKRRRIEREASESSAPMLNGRVTKSPTSQPASNKDRKQLQRPPTAKVLPTTDSPDVNGLQDQSPPAVERSILADIKRRPRQASILSNVNVPGDDNLDDPSDLDDLDDLEPNDESTPIDSRTRTINGRISATPSIRGERRGSRVPPTPAVIQRKSSPEQLSPHQNVGDLLPQHSISPLRPVQPPDQGQEDSDTYAPPQSSSPPQSNRPQRTHEPMSLSSILGLSADSAIQSTERTTKKASHTRNTINPSPRNQYKAPSTQSLEYLMPQPRKGRRLRQKPKDDFDIPSDISSNNGDTVASPLSPDDSSFLQSSKGQRVSRKSTMARANSNVLSGSRRKTGKDNTIKTTSATKGKPPKRAAQSRKTARQGIRKQSTPPPNSHSSPVHSLPSQSPEKDSTTKTISPSQLHQHKSTAYTYGNANPRSSRLRRGSDKENQRVDGNLGGDGGSAFSSSPPSVLETTPDIADDAHRRRGNRAGRDGKDLSAEMSDLRRKFADVDDWGLEFEDVSGGGGGSSPKEQWR